jgi:hypothetical protein
MASPMVAGAQRRAPRDRWFDPVRRNRLRRFRPTFHVATVQSIHVAQGRNPRSGFRRGLAIMSEAQRRAPRGRWFDAVRRNRLRRFRPTFHVATVPSIYVARRAEPAQRIPTRPRDHVRGAETRAPWVDSSMLCGGIACGGSALPFTSRRLRRFTLRVGRNPRSGFRRGLAIMSAAQRRARLGSIVRSCAAESPAAVPPYLSRCDGCVDSRCA